MQFNRQQFSGLELLSTSLLEEIIRADFNGEADYSEDMIQYVLELIAQRRKEEQPEAIPSAQEAWKSLQLRMDAEDSFDLSQLSQVQKRKKSRHGNKHVFRYVAVVAACVAMLFAMLITVQAMGIDVFGAIGRWTDDTFRFEVTQDKNIDTVGNSDCAEGTLGEALAEMDMPTNLAPSWIPEEYTLTSAEQAQTKMHKGVYEAYTKSGVDKSLTIGIEEFFNPLPVIGMLYEKSPGDPETYVKNGRQFYLFENSGTWTATWSDTRFTITIAGVDSKETAIEMIDSIQEDTHE